MTLPTGDELERAWANGDAEYRRQIVSEVIDHIDVSGHPSGVASAPPRRAEEPLNEWRARFDAARMDIVEQRTFIHWIV